MGAVLSRLLPVGAAPIMRIISIWLTSPHQRRWLLQLVSLGLGFSLLVSSVWLYYDYKVRQLEQQQRQLSEPDADP